MDRDSKFKRKRNRIPLSCTICRKRKVKCDKSRPRCDQCTKTGVSHLCHYMEQTWAEEAEKFLSKESELKQLKERVKMLEEALSMVHQKTVSSASQTPIKTDKKTIAMTTPALRLENDNDKYANDELDLTSNFDMLHLKKNGTVHLGATHWLAIMKGDPYLKLLWGHIFTMREKLNEWYLKKKTGTNVKNTSGTPSKCPVDHSKLTKLSGCPIDHKKMKISNLSGCPVDHSQFTTAKSGKPLPSFGEIASKCPIKHEVAAKSFPQTSAPPQHTEYRQAIEKVASLLPPHKLVIEFVDIFFKHIYPTIPIIDEMNFRNFINHTLSSRSTNSENILPLSINKLADLCNLGILVIILRLTWLSLPENSVDIDLGPNYKMFYLPNDNNAGCCSLNEIRKGLHLVNYETPLEALELVRKDLIKFDEITSISNNNVNLTTVQFAVFYKLYLMCCPNDSSDVMSNSAGQDNESHQVLLSSIIQMAFSCGLHRDPDNFPQLNTMEQAFDPNLKPQKAASTDKNATPLKQSQSTTERVKHTWRKTWYYIVSLDVQQSLALGTPRLLRNLRDFSDTKLPSASKIDYVKDIKELIVVKNFTLFFQLDLVIISVLNHILNVSVAKNVRKFELDQLIKHLKDLTYNRRNITDIVNDLINSGLLFASEGAVETTVKEETYGLPSLEEVTYSLPPEFVTKNEADSKLDLSQESATKALFFSKHLTLRTLLYILSYILFTHYEPLGSVDAGTTAVSKQYAQETLNYAIEGLRNSILFFTNISKAQTNHQMFSYLDMVLAPQCLDVGNRSLQFIVCLILRAKCGPLSGAVETSILTPSTSDGTGIKGCPIMKKTGVEDKTDDLAKNGLNEEISIDMGESLADVLTQRMILFQKLTKQLSSKYYNAIRLMRSSGFFITLLAGKVPGHKIDNNPNSTSDKKKGIYEFSNISGFFKNVPSLIFSGNGDSLKRCPVYQDALGFVAPTGMNMGSNNIGMFPSSLPAGLRPQGKTAESTQLPPLRPYKPVTYAGTTSDSSHHIKRPSSMDLLANDRKRPKIKHPNRNNFIPSLSPTAHPVTPVETSEHVNNIITGQLPPLQNITRQPQQTLIGNNMNNVNMSQYESKLLSNTDTSSMEQFNTFTSPESENESGGIPPSAPELEDFLMKNSEFNGLFINPSSFVEAVGFPNLDNVPLGSGAGEFLPIDNGGLDSLTDNTLRDFSLWE